ncbi:uncharacterized protein LOC134827876 [Culicoides brevitarsis]|uniref:uncharacterized protein LOC134827876 n=1 Tax=Culicoides brevitarsis TaxID=469753 RepID=UPI00307C3263
MKRGYSEIHEDSSKRVKFMHNKTIDDLPVEILMLIFEKLSSTERRNLMCVRQYYMAIVNEHFSRDNCLILTKKLDYSQDGELYSTFQRRENFENVHRTFPYLVIKSFPSKFSDFVKMTRFIDLVATEIQSLKIIHMPLLDIVTPSNFYNELFYLKMENLAELEVSDPNLLGNLSFPDSLERIDIQNLIYDVKLIYKIRALNISTLKSKSIKLFKNSYNSMDHFMDPDMKEALNEIFTKTTSVIVESNFNYCGEEKISFNDVTCFRFESGARFLCASDFMRFTKLETLHICIHESSNPMPLIANGQFCGIKNLDLYAINAPPVDQFEKIFFSFPDCETLTIDGFKLQSSHFALICKNMPKLKNLILLNGSSMNLISVNALVSQNDASLKDLKHLEKVIIETCELVNAVEELRWPELPNLHTLSLSGWCFQQFNEELYESMARNSPKINHLKINTEGGACLNSCFVPLINTCPLISLILPGEGDEYSEDFEKNGLLLSNIAKHCKQLEFLSVNDSKGLLMGQEILLFNAIPSLKTIKSVIAYEDFPDTIRVFTREDLFNLKEYLKINLHKYKDIFDTIEYVMSNIIPFNDVMNMLDEYAEQLNHRIENLEHLDNVRKLFIVGVKFLQMDNVDLCRIAYAVTQT